MPTSARPPTIGPLSGVRIAGTGHYLPGPPIDSGGVRLLQRRWPDPLPEKVQERLLEGSGVLTRHYAMAADGTRSETNASMAAAAGRRALEAAGWTANDVDLLIVTTVVPDHLIPPTSTLVQEALGIRTCAEFDISGNCSAPYKALLAAGNQLRLGQRQRALVCSSQLVSFLGTPPWGDPAQMTASQAQLRWLLSDGAGAIALERHTDDCALEIWTESRGCGRPPGMELRWGAAAPELTAETRHVTQHARRLRDDGVREGVAALVRMVEVLHVDASAIAHFIPEIPSTAIAAEAAPLLATMLGLPESAWRVDLAEIGNVGGATFPIVLDRLHRAGRLRPGELVVSFAEESSKWIFAGLALRWAA